jgi:CRP-like cAMP-binding protein
MPDHTDTVEIIKSIPLLAGLGRRDRSVLAKDSRLLRFEAFTKLVTQGDRGQSCFVLLEGTAEVIRNSKVVAELAAGAVFGELSLIDGGERTADIMTLTRGEALEIQRARFEELMSRSPSAARSVMEQLSLRIRELDSTVFG